MSEIAEQFEQLEEKILQAIELFKQAQAERLAGRKEIEKLRTECRERAKVIDGQERELVALRREREEVRIRIEKLLQRIDALTGPEPSR